MTRVTRTVCCRKAREKNVPSWHKGRWNPTQRIFISYCWCDFRFRSPGPVRSGVIQAQIHFRQFYFYLGSSNLCFYRPYEVVNQVTFSFIWKCYQISFDKQTKTIFLINPWAASVEGVCPVKSSVASLFEYGSVRSRFEFKPQPKRALAGRPSS